jgi:thioredoxin 2
MKTADASLVVPCPHCAALNRVPGEKLGNEPACGRCHQALFTGKPLALDAAGFERHVGAGSVPVLVDFWAPWCGPCLSMAPAYAEAASRLEPKVRVIKVNTEEAPRLSAQLGIRSIPTLAVFRNGKEVARTAGAMSAEQLVRFAAAA